MERRVGVLALAVAVAAGLGSVALTQTVPSAEPRVLAPSDAPVMGLLIGWSFAGAGVVASVLRPQNRFGVLLYGTGLTWFLSALMATDSALWFTVGLLTAPGWLGLFLHALPAFPGGRMDGRWDRWLVGLLVRRTVLDSACRRCAVAAGRLRAAVRPPGAGADRVRHRGPPGGRDGAVDDARGRPGRRTSGARRRAAAHDRRTSPGAGGAR